MQLEKNGFASTGKRTKHFEIRFWFTTDLVKKSIISIEHCPTLDMVADVLTKPLQCSLFQRQRNTIMGINGKDIASYNLLARSLLRIIGLGWHWFCVICLLFVCMVMKSTDSSFIPGVFCGILSADTESGVSCMTSVDVPLILGEISKCETRSK